MISVERAERVLQKFSGQKILVIGDLIVDRYVSGSVSRISPEAPVPVVRVTSEDCRPGGAANVALNIQSLGGQAIAAGIVGRDREAEDLESMMSSYGISTAGVMAADEGMTTVKTRILADRQQVVRVDREEVLEPTKGLVKRFCTKITDVADDVAGVIIEDYGKGALSQPVIDVVLSMADDSDFLVGFDPKDNHDIKVAGVTLATPNYREALAAAGLPDSPLRDDPASDDSLARAGSILLTKWNTDLLIITLGPHGMYMLCRNEEPQVIPTKAREVFDVSGAGDTVIAATLLSLIGGARYYEAASLANYAAGVVVGKVGTATCTPDELLAHIG